MSRQENPAKVFLRRYKALSGRVDALQRAIDEALARATNTGITLKEIKVLSSPAEHDPMARDICNAVDACEILYQYKAEAETALREILSAIDSLKDERQKEVLTRRYVTGQGYPEIAEQMNYSEGIIYIVHGRALVAVNKWLETQEQKRHGYGENNYMLINERRSKNEQTDDTLLGLRERL